MTLWDDLKAEFPREAISWRAQTLTKNGDKALALAYIDARDVMNRLDSVVGPQNWQNRYEVHGNKTICYLSIRDADDPVLWITKADGAGDTDVEAEKGSISDALKRAAVLWGIGRYLYDIPAPWVPCETYEKGGKQYWSKWTDDPWNYVKGKPQQQAPSTPKPKQKTVAERKAIWSALMEEVKQEGAKGFEKIDTYMLNADTQKLIADLGDYKDDFIKEVRQIRKMTQAAQETSGQPVGKIMERVMPDFTNLDTSPDPLEELLGANQGDN